MKKLSLWLFPLLLMLLAVVPAQASLGSGLYVDGRLGQVDVSEPGVSNLTTIGIVVGQPVAPGLSLEVSYDTGIKDASAGSFEEVIGGSYAVGDADWNGNIFGVWLKASHDLSPDLALHGRVGHVKKSVTVNLSGVAGSCDWTGFCLEAPFTESASESKSGVAFSVGVTLNNQFSIDYADLRDDVKMVSISMRF